MATPTAPGSYFKAATWNVYHGTGVGILGPILEDLIDDDVVLFFLQEAYGKDIADLLSKNGLRFYQAGEGAVAWDPKHFTLIGPGKLIPLAQSLYFRANGSGKGIVTDMPTVILSDMWGRTVTAGSYHTPASVQKAPDDIPVNRLKVIREATATWRRLEAEAQTRAVVFAGDDNLDETKLKGAFWDFWLKNRGGLTELQAPSPTHGHAKTGRYIDSFRVNKGVTAATGGSVRAGGGDHRVHVRLFRWA